jgi:hypothetical protein
VDRLYEALAAQSPDTAGATAMPTPWPLSPSPSKRQVNLLWRTRGEARDGQFHRMPTAYSIRIHALYDRRAASSAPARVPSLRRPYIRVLRVLAG